MRPIRLLLLATLALAGSPLTTGADSGSAAGIVTWANAYSYSGIGNTTIGIDPASLLETPDGGYLVGTTGPYGGTILKLDSLANPQWQKLYDCACTVKALALSPQGGYIAAVVTNFTDETYFRILKISAAGDLIWAKLYRRNRFDSAETITATDDGGYLIGAFTSPRPLDRKGQMWLIKIGAAGAIQWQKTYNVARPTSIQQLTGGDFLIGTTLFSVLRLDRSGAVKWQKRYSGNACCFSGIMRAKEDGTFYLAGETTDLPALVFIKANSSGRPLVSRRYSSARGLYLADFQISPQGVAYFLSEILHRNNLAAFLLAVDSLGNILGKEYDNRGNDLDIPEVLELTTDGGVLIASSSGLLVKTDQLGSLAVVCSVTISPSVARARQFQILADTRLPTVTLTHVTPVIEQLKTITLTPIVQTVCPSQ